MVQFIKELPLEVNEDLLDEQLKAAGFLDRTINIAQQFLMVKGVLADDETALDTILITHNASDKTSDQLQDNEDNTSFSDFQSIVATALAQIESDETALQNATSFTDSKPLLANMMLRDKKTIKALAGLIRRLT